MSTPASIELEQKLECARQELLGSDAAIYLGSDGVEKELEWFIDGRESYLIQMDEDAVPEAEDAPEPVLLSLVGQITRNDTFLAPDGYYKVCVFLCIWFDVSDAIVFLGSECVY